MCFSVASSSMFSIMEVTKASFACGVDTHSVHHTTLHVTQERGALGDGWDVGGAKCPRRGGGSSLDTPPLPYIVFVNVVWHDAAQLQHLHELEDAHVLPLARCTISKKHARGAADTQGTTVGMGTWGEPAPHSWWVAGQRQRRTNAVPPRELVVHFIDGCQEALVRHVHLRHTKHGRGTRDVKEGGGGIQKQ
jgi:hypothetical protein